MKRLCIDLETMSTGKDAAILAIGAVQFDPSEGITSQFYRVVSLKSSLDAGLAVDPQTILWWLGQNEEARFEFTHKSGITLLSALHGLTSWLLDIGFDGHPHKEIWANSPSFDCEILRNALQAVGLPTPWNYREERDVRTLAAVFPKLHARHGKPRHIAITDAYDEALFVITCLNQLEVLNGLDTDQTTLAG